MPITHITNGVHVSNWMARRMREFCSTNIWAKIGIDHLDDPDLWTKHRWHPR